MSLLVRKEIEHGYNAVVAENDPRLRYLSFDFILLRAGESHEARLVGREAVFVVLSGRCNITVNEHSYRGVGRRTNPFASKAFAVYAPTGTTYLVEALTDLEVAVCLSKADVEKVPCLITPAGVKERIVGKGNWQRSVYDIVDDSVDACRLLVGETINPPGNWSSVPPHKHAVDSIPEESDMEEAYFFRIDPPQGFGVIRVYTDDRTLDETYSVVNNDLVLIPEGYHPVGALAGYRVYYLWMLAGEKRTLKVRDDPRHAWIKAGKAHSRAC